MSLQPRSTVTQRLDSVAASILSTHSGSVIASALAPSDDLCSRRLMSIGQSAEVDELGSIPEHGVHVELTRHGPAAICPRSLMSVAWGQRVPGSVPSSTTSTPATARPLSPFALAR